LTTATSNTWRGRNRMWIFTKHGFFSAVCARKGNGKHGQPVDPDRIMVRGRLRSHLKALKERFPNLIGECDIQETAGTDYAFRLFVPKPAWVQVFAGLAEETDYDNFKSEVANHQGEAGAAYEHSLHDVWSVMHKLQQTEGLLPITAKQIDALLPFLERFEAAGFSAGTWNAPEGQFPWFDFNEVVTEFHQALYDNGWVTPAFDWTEWQESAKKFVDSPMKIAKADATTIQKLLTTHSRKDRFCEGHLAAMFENGHIVALLRQLRELRKSEATKDSTSRVRNNTKGIQ